MDRRTDMTKPVAAFRQFANAPNNNGQKQGIAARPSLGNNVAWYSEGADFECQTEYRPSWLGLYVDVFSPSRNIQGEHLKLRHPQYLPLTLQYINP
jgi:hypothetical protein